MIFMTDEDYAIWRRIKPVFPLKGCMEIRRLSADQDARDFAGMLKAARDPEWDGDNYGSQTEASRDG